MKSVDELKEEFAAALEQADSSDLLEALRLTYMGKKGVLKSLFEEMKGLSTERRQIVAPELNSLKSFIETALQTTSTDIGRRETTDRINSEWLDLSLPSTATERGSLHPLTVIERRCLDVLSLLGFTFVDGPEVETPFNNFDALNIPEHHPARDMQDTFWLENNLLLRSHTSTVQIRTLLSQKELPICIASPGRVYRNEAVDATHLACFHQFEGMWVDTDIKFSHCKGTIEFIIAKIFGDDWDYRFKPKFYPYTEPSIGVDVRRKNGDGKWLTILGAGMVHPNVFRATGHDPERVSGFAFGLGISRMVSVAHTVANMKSLYEGDLRVHRSLARKEYRSKALLRGVEA